MASGTLDLPTRRSLYMTIRAQPGLHQRELQRACGLATGALEHHLRVLEGEGLVATREEANRKRYFASDVPRQDKDLLRLLRTRPSRAMVLALLGSPGLSLSDLAERVGLGVSSAHAHAKRLVDAGIVVKTRDGSSVALAVADPSACVRVLTAYRPTFVDRAVDRFLETFGAVDRDALRP